jgi:hypothetical protein
VISDPISKFGFQAKKCYGTSENYECLPELNDVLGILFILKSLP